MVKRILVFPLLFLIIALLVPRCNGKHVFGFQNSLSPIETQIIELVNGTRAYGYDLALEEISLTHPDFRSSGSSGAYEAAVWIKEQFESFGLNAWLEPFTFVNWTLEAKPLLIIDEDGDNATTQDQTIVNSFQCEHYSWPLPSGAFKDLAVLPLPPAANRHEVGSYPIDIGVWSAINTTDKIVLIGREVRWDYHWDWEFKNKLRAQRPAAVIFTWWYDWMGFTPPVHFSAGGLPLGAYPIFWDLQIPVGFVSHADGLMIRQKEEADRHLSAYVEIKARINQNGTHYNVIGKIEGASDPEKFVIVSAHYDTVTCCGFCDNGAGVAGIIELAKVVSQAIQEGLYQPAYKILFVTFAGEELYLVGSAHFVQEHRNEVANIQAVINLDCIGSDNLYVTETPDSQLAQKIIEAAQDLGISIELENVSDSDHESFRSPADVNNAIQRYWNKDLGISDVPSVTSSAMIISYPLLYTDFWSRGVAGWIHTSYDNSTSTETLNWVESDELENHIKVALLALIRLSPNLIYQLTISTTTGGTASPSPGIYNYIGGTQLTVTAIPYAGYSFARWLLDGEIRTENPITIVMDASHTLEAHFIDNIRPEICDPIQDPLGDVEPYQNVTVTVNVTDYGSGVKNVTLWYSINNGTSWNPINMTEISVNTYKATILGHEYCTWVTYKIVAYDNAGNNATKDNFGYYYKYHIISEFSSTLILPLFLTSALLIAIFSKRKQT